MEREPKRHLWWKLLFCSIPLMLFIVFTQCKDDDDKPVYNPAEKTEITEFYPDTGGVGTQIIIRGKNFGTDKDLITVFINNDTAKLIGVNDTRIYAIVP